MVVICVVITAALLSAPKKGVLQWIHALKRQDSRFDLARQSLWSKLPDNAQTMLPVLRPISTNESHHSAWVALPKIGPGDKDSVGVLIRALDDPFPDVREWSIQAIARIGLPATDATGHLIRLLRDSSCRKPLSHGVGSLHGAVAHALGNVAPAADPIFSSLEEMLKESRDEDISSAAEALTFLAVRSDDPVRHLLDALRAVPPRKLESHLAQTDLLWAVGNVRPVTPKVLNALTSLFEDADFQLRLEAVGTIARLGPLAKPSLPQLTALFDRTASEQWPGIYGRSGYAPISIDTGVQTWGLHRQVIIALGQVGKDSSALVPLLIKEYKNPTNVLRFDAAFARWRIDREVTETLSILASGLTDPDGECRTAALGHISEMASDSQEAVKLIISALHDSDMHIRSRAIDILSNLGHKAAPAIPDLVELTNDPKYGIKFAARELVQKLRASGPER